jgi:Lon protease-like protein
MVRECLDSKSPFGMLLALPDGIVRVGCTAEILEVLKRYEDGRMDIITVGRDPFRVVELFSGDPLLEGHVDYLEDTDSTAASQSIKQLVELYETCHTLLFSGIPKDFDSVPPDQLAYTIAAALPLDLLWKQQLLELRTESERQHRLSTYLRDWAPHLQKVETLRHRAGGNGSGLN